jgi:hypothetical protein
MIWIKKWTVEVALEIEDRVNDNNREDTRDVP